jgi:hypothetical protein
MRHNRTDFHMSGYATSQVTRRLHAFASEKGVFQAESRQGFLEGGFNHLQEQKLALVSLAVPRSISACPAL